VQPRIRLGRSFDQRSHTYPGYVLRVRGNIGSEVREFLVGVGKARTPNTSSRWVIPSPAKHCRLPIRVWRPFVREVVEETPPPPWRGVPPPLSVYRERGHRRLAVRTYEEKCTTCIWGCQMAVEM